MRKYVLSLVVALFFSSSIGFTQSSDFGNWLMYFGNKKLPKNFNLHHEVQYRNYNVAGDLEQLLLRAGLGYNLAENNNNLLIGYGYILSQNYLGASDEKVDVSEHRIYQQFVSKQSFGRFSFMHRYRIEERWVERDFRVRFRYMLNAKFALTKPSLIAKTLYLVAYDELFINTSGNKFDRNRLYGGLGYKVTDSFSVELGYLNQYFNVGGRDQLNLGVFWKY